jgi:hypothetical protein
VAGDVADDSPVVPDLNTKMMKIILEHRSGDTRPGRNLNTPPEAARTHCHGGQMLAQAKTLI